MPEKASLVTYDTRMEKFESVYERNKFYRGLFGYKQTVRKNDKTYHYEKDGIMDSIPNVRVDDSVFIVPETHLKKLEDYLKRWGEKVAHHVFTVLVEDQEILDTLNSGTTGGDQR